MYSNTDTHLTARAVISCRSSATCLCPNRYINILTVVIMVVITLDITLVTTLATKLAIALVIPLVFTLWQTHHADFRGDKVAQSVEPLHVRLKVGRLLQVFVRRLQSQPSQSIHCGYNNLTLSPAAQHCYLSQQLGDGLEPT